MPNTKGKTAQGQLRIEAFVVGSSTEISSGSRCKIFSVVLITSSSLALFNAARSSASITNDVLFLSTEGVETVTVLTRISDVETKSLSAIEED